MKVYEMVNEKISSLLAKGTVPWHKPWTPSTYKYDDSEVIVGAPMNLKSKKPYRGCNVWLLLAMGYESPWWLTYKQAIDLGGHVKSGERGTPVVYWNFVRKTEKNKKGEDTEVSIPFLKYYTVFNIEQCELPEGRIPQKIEESTIPTTKEEQASRKIAAGEAIVSGYQNGPMLRHQAGDRACYNFVTDVVTVPEEPQFKQINEYYSTLFHELGHSTGHESRLDRTFGRAFGDKNYAREELCAEMTAAYLCATAGIEGTFDNSAAYLANWQKELKDDQYLFIVAAGKAQAAADHILGVESAESKDEE